MNIVIISQNQMAYIIPMYETLKEQFGDDLKALWVFDRCADKSVEIAKLLKINYLCNSEGSGRQTSYCRNIGLQEITEKYGLDATIFLDGDRIPVSNLNTTYNTDISLLSLENDFRNTREVDYQVRYGTVYNDFFSCGVVIKKEALKKLAIFYREHEEDYKNSIAFPETVQEFWGIEDTHLGDICYHLGLSCDYRPDLILMGTFDRNTVDSLDVIETRFRLRDKLNVKW